MLSCFQYVEYNRLCVYDMKNRTDPCRRMLLAALHDFLEVIGGKFLEAMVLSGCVMPGVNLGAPLPSAPQSSIDSTSEFSRAAH